MIQYSTVLYTTRPGARQCHRLNVDHISNKQHISCFLWHVLIFLSQLPWIFLGVSLEVNGAPGNIQGNLLMYVTHGEVNAQSLIIFDTTCYQPRNQFCALTLKRKCHFDEIFITGYTQESVILTFSRSASDIFCKNDDTFVSLDHGGTRDKSK